MKTINCKLPSGDLASRRLAIAERHKIETCLISNTLVYLDLSDVESISESYSDEIFGVLVKKYGIDAVLKLVRVQNASSSILKSIATVIKRRSIEATSYKNRQLSAAGNQAHVQC